MSTRGSARIGRRARSAALVEARSTLDACPADVRFVLTRCEALRLESEGFFDIRGPGLMGGLDPSGYVKGWAVEEAAYILEAAGARNYAINAGGDVIMRGAGTRPALGRRDPPPARRRPDRCPSCRWRRVSSAAPWRPRGSTSAAGTSSIPTPEDLRATPQHDRGRPEPGGRRCVRDGELRDGPRRSRLARRPARLRRLRHRPRPAARLDRRLGPLLKAATDAAATTA